LLGATSARDAGVGDRTVDDGWADATTLEADEVGDGVAEPTPTDGGGLADPPHATTRIAMAALTPTLRTREDLPCLGPGIMRRDRRARVAAPRKRRVR
jgi:hypothetical protein